MGCFLDCFVKKKERRRRKKSAKRVQPNDQRNGCDVALHPAISLNQDQRNASDEPLEPAICLNKDSTEEPTAPVAEARDKLDEPLSFGIKKKVTFDLNVQAYENNSTQEDDKYESEEEKEQKGTKEGQLNPLSEDGSSITNVGSFPSNHRYQNCSISDDEYEAESEFSDLDDDSDDYFDDEDEYDYRTAEEEYSKSVSQRGPEVRVDEKEVNSLLCHGSHRSVLSPIENLTQWKAVKMSSKPPLKQQMAKVDLEKDVQTSLSPETSFTFSTFSSTSKMDQSGSPNIAVDTSFSKWLASSEATPSSKTSNFSSGIESAERSKSSPRSYSPQSHEDRPILGALTLEELRQFSVTSSPRKSPSRSPDEMPIFGNVGSYWSNTEEASDSSSTSPCNGIGNATSRYREVFVK